MVNAGTQIRATTAPFISLGCYRNATARGRSGPGCPPFLPEVIQGNTSRSLCSAAWPQGRSRSPMVTQFTSSCTGWQPSFLRGDLGPNSAMKNNPGFINPMEKRKGWFCLVLQLSALGTGWIHNLSSFPGTVLLVQPRRTSTWDANLPDSPRRLLATRRIHPS